MINNFKLLLTDSKTKAHVHAALLGVLFLFMLFSAIYAPRTNAQHMPLSCGSVVGCWPGGGGVIGRWCHIDTYCTDISTGLQHRCLRVMCCQGSEASAICNTDGSCDAFCGAPGSGTPGSPPKYKIMGSILNRDGFAIYRRPDNQEYKVIYNPGGDTPWHGTDGVPFFRNDHEFDEANEATVWVDNLEAGARCSWVHKKVTPLGPDNQPNTGDEYDGPVIASGDGCSATIEIQGECLGNNLESCNRINFTVISEDTPPPPEQITLSGQVYCTEDNGSRRGLSGVHIFHNQQGNNSILTATGDNGTWSAQKSVEEWRGSLRPNGHIDLHPQDGQPDFPEGANANHLGGCVDSNIEGISFAQNNTVIDEQVGCGDPTNDLYDASRDAIASNQVNFNFGPCERGINQCFNITPPPVNLISPGHQTSGYSAVPPLTFDWSHE